MPFQSEGRDKQEMTVRLVRKQEVLTLDRPLQSALLSHSGSLQP